LDQRVGAVPVSATGAQVRVAIVDDDVLTAHLLAHYLSSRPGVEALVIGGDPPALVEACRSFRSDLVLVSARSSPVATIRLLADRAAEIGPVVLLAGADETHDVMRGLRAGAVAQVRRSEPPERLMEALSGVLADPPSPAEALQALAAEGSWRPMAPGAAESELSPREMEVLQAFTSGRSTEEVAEDLHISPATVRSHVKRILTKTGARSRLEAVAIGLREGWIDAPGRP